MLGGGGKSSCTLSKTLVLATVRVHETSLANQHFYSMLLGGKEGVCIKSTLCTLVKIMDGPLSISLNNFPLIIVLYNWVTNYVTAHNTQRSS